MRRAGAFVIGIAIAAGLSGCANLQGHSCPAGQERLRTAQLFFGRDASGGPAAPDAAFHKFLDEEITPRFPDGLTVLDGGGQWKGEENRRIREASKVVQFVVPRASDSQTRLDAVRRAYKVRFKKDSVLVVAAPACVTL